MCALWTVVCALRTKELGLRNDEFNISFKGDFKGLSSASKEFSCSTLQVST